MWTGFASRENYPYVGLFRMNVKEYIMIKNLSAMIIRIHRVCRYSGIRQW